MKPIISILLILLVFCGSSMAGVETASNRISGNQISVAASVSANDNNLQLPSAKIAGASGKVIFSIDPASNLYIGAAYTVKLGLEITSLDNNQVSQSITTELVVNYNPSQSYQDKSVYIVNGSHNITATIVYIRDENNVAIPHGSVLIPQNLSLEVEQSTERYYLFDPASTDPIPIYNTLLTASNELDVHWDVIPGAEEYEFEWTYVNNYDPDGGYLPANMVDWNFRNNSTRVRISDTHYRISLLFDQGFVVYRVRGIGRSFTDLSKEIMGKWSANDGGNFNVHYRFSPFYGAIAGHEKNKNWQYSASYAEDGKKKEVVSYFDGSLRNRQSVTKTNTENQTIVGETIYDYQGRGAIQVLPTPHTDTTDHTAKSTIKFFPDFNKNVSAGVRYSRLDFDLDTSGQPACNTTTAGMSATSGSSNYYSPANPNQSGAQGYVPDAKLFPFTQVEYTPDNTGRIRRQSGVGADHRLGTNHETKYFYGQPEQVQLDRMFGSEVGDYKHYKKNMVMDANGQISVSYLDQKGRVVATSLAGAPPSNVTKLDGPEPSATVTIDYLRSNGKGDGVNETHDNALVFSKELLVATQGMYTFSYDVESPVYHPCDALFPLCYDCIYDLEISVKNACGEDMFTPVMQQVGTIDSTCGASITFSTPPAALTPTLSVGSYTVYKKLTISETALEYYTQNYIANSQCIAPFSAFLDSAMANIDTTACSIDCEKCAQLLGLYSAHSDLAKATPGSSTYDPNYEYMTQEEYDNAVKDCKAPCQPANLCESQYQTLLSDVSPGGQYATYKITYDGTTGMQVFNSTDPLSLFTFNNSLPDRSSSYCYNCALSYWRNPKIGTDYHYYNEDGTLSKIYVTLNQDGTYYPKPDLSDHGSGYQVVKEDADGKGPYIYPQDLNNEVDFINAFANHPNWAKSLVEYHPEYKYYEWCIKNNTHSYSELPVAITGSATASYTSDEYDDLLRSKNTYAGALAAGLLDGTTNAVDLLNQDPYFADASPQDGQGYSLGQQNIMLNKIMSDYHVSGKNLKAFAAATVRCGTVYYGTCNSNSVFGSNIDYKGDVISGAALIAIQDKEWALYRDMYLSEKQKLQQSAADKFAKTNSPEPAKTNSCIGIKDGAFNPWTFGAWPWQGNITDPCGIVTWSLYKNKIKRFGNGSDVMPGVDPFADPQTGMDVLDNNVGYNMYLETGQCPKTLDLGFLLNELASHTTDGNALHTRLVTANDLVTCPAFTKNLYDALDAIHTQFIKFNWIPSAATGTNLIAYFGNAATSVNTATLTLTPPSGTWAAVKRFSNIKYKYSSGGVSYFTIHAFSDSPVPGNPPITDVLTGSITILMNDCSFPDNCGPSPIALKLQNLFNTLNAAGKLNASVNLITDDRVNGISPYLSVFANNTLVEYTTLNWNGSTDPKTLASQLSGETSCTAGFGFSFYNATNSVSTGHANSLADVKYFAHIRPNNSPSTGHFDIDAWVLDDPSSTDPNSPGHFEPMNVNTGETGCYDFKECLPPPDIACTGPEYKVNEGLLAGLNTFARQNRLIPQNRVLLTPEFKNIFPFDECFELGWKVNSGDYNTGAKTLTVTIDCGTIPPHCDTCQPDPIIVDKCKILMQFSDLGTANTYTNIVSFSNLQVPSSGNGNVFSLLAHFNDGTSQILNCSTTCLQLKTCERCTDQLQYGNPVYQTGFEETIGNNSYSAFSPGSCLLPHLYSGHCENGYLQMPVIDANEQCYFNHTLGAAHSESNFLFFDYSNVTNGPSGVISLWQSPTCTVQTNTNYRYSAFYKIIDYVTRAVNSTPPWSQYTLSLKINNTVVASTDAAAVALGAWKEWNGTWNSGSEDLVTLEIVISGAWNFNDNHNRVGFDDISLTPFTVVPCEHDTLPEPLDSIPYHNPCVEQLLAVANANAHASYNAYIKSKKDKFRKEYLDICKGALENLEMVYTDREHHTTLYYYDQAGSLIKTVPPAGVALVTSPSALDSIRQDRLHNKQTFFTQHTLQTKYEYNSLGQLLRQATPDNELTNKWTLNGSPTLPTSSNIYGMAFSNGNNGYVVGDDGAGVGVIYTTSNAGATWSPVSTIGIANLKDVQFISADPTTGYAISDAGYLVKTTDAGATWVTLATGTTQKLNDLYFSDAQNGVVIGNGGVILKTTNGGTSWSASTVPPLNLLVNYYDMYFNEGNSSLGFIAGDKATVLRTTNGGSTWTNLPGTIVGAPNTGLQFNAIHFDATNNNVYVAGVNPSSSTGFIAKATIDENTPSTTWFYPVASPAPSGVEFKSIFAVDATTVFAAGTNGKLYKSTDAGGTFAPQTISSLTPSTAEITELSFPDPANPGQGYATAKNGQFIKSNATGTTWAASNITIGSQANVSPLNGLYFDPSAPLTGYAAGNGGTLLKTTDGAITWSSLTNIILPKLKATCMVPLTSVGYAVGENASIVKTINGGSSWTPLIHNLSTAQLNGVAFESTTTGMAVGNAGTALEITGGNTVVSLSSHVTGNLNDVAFIPGSSGIYLGVGDNGAIIKGAPASLSSVSQSITTQNLNSICFADNKTGYACGNNGVVIKTINGGSAWTATGVTHVTSPLHKIYFKDLLVGYALGDAGTILKTIDGGAHWSVQPNAGLTSQNFNTAAFTGNGQALIAGTGTPNLAALNDESYDYSSRFFYDRLGRLIVSQNTKQFNKAPKAYSYTIYDALGRIKEVGEIADSTDIATLTSNHGVISNDAQYSAWLSAGTKTEITRTLYDTPATLSPLPSPSFTQENLRTRVSSIQIDENGDGVYEHATYFRYDIHGNVKSLLQDIPALSSQAGGRYKRVDYEYDLVSGNVNLVKYQDGQPDAFYHQYEYDADNRITNVYTNTTPLSLWRGDGGEVGWDQDAKYFYYPHGPLARTELGDQKVQAMDYAYTIQGWIKGVNSNILSEHNDIGKDGDISTSNTINGKVARNAFGYSLNYFTGDYRSINNSQIQPADNFIASVTSAAWLQTDAPDLYNGNISSMVTTLPDLTPLGGSGGGPQLTAYQYDQLNRIKQMKAYHGLTTANTWSVAVTDNSYRENFDYDANGNILTLTRNGVASNLNMDILSYKYKNKANGYDRNTNQLVQVQDAVGNGAYTVDIDNQNPDNYTYDETGNLKSDAQEEIASIDWTVYGKIKSITRTSFSTKDDLEFHYDASGNRAAKIVKPHGSASSAWTTTYYVRDASGNTIATYEDKPNDSDLYLQEQNLFGSARLGVLKRNLNLNTYSVTPNIFTHTMGQKSYELNNHLGNVLVTVSDRKLPHSTNGAIVDYFNADITSASDYYAFGAPMPGRSYNSTSYRYGQNSQEKDDEIFNGAYTAEFWEYDSRSGRRWNRDPIVKAWESPYATFSNNPVRNNDVKGNTDDPADKKNVVVDPGHGGEDPGALGTKGKKNEEDITLEISKGINDRLKVLNTQYIEAQTNVTNTRTTDMNPGGCGQDASLKARADISKAAQADLFVAVHVNSADDANADYVSVITQPGANDVSKKLQTNIADAFNGVVQTNQGVKNDAEQNLSVLRNQNANTGAVLVEVGFITNPKQQDLLNDPNYLKNIGNSIADAIFKTAYPNAVKKLDVPAPPTPSVASYFWQK